jgi:hypothetical protein
LERVVQKCKTNLAKKDASPSEAAQAYAEAVLDYTFIDESVMVEESFPRDSWRPRIKAIFSKKIFFNVFLDYFQSLYQQGSKEIYCNKDLKC